MSCGEKISRLRKSKGMTQEDLGKILNVTYQAVSKWERGESLPDFETMSQIARYFQVPLGYFEDGAPEEPFPLAERENEPKETSAHGNCVGVCTVCGKMLKEDEVFEYSPKIVCKACTERQLRERERAKKEALENQKRAKERDVQTRLGRGFDAKLIVSLIVALALYILLTVTVFLNRSSDDELIYGAMLFLVPLAAFGCTHALAEFINDLRGKEDETDGYTRNKSLIVAGGFAVVNIVVFLILYLTSQSSYNIFFLILLFAGAVLSFTFVSQFLWGGSVKEIFTCGGFTFKMPGFIFSLSIDSILWMIVAKIFLGIVSVIVFLVTTVFFSLIAILGSLFLFVPSVISKTVKDRNARAELQ